MANNSTPSFPVHPTPSDKDHVPVLEVTIVLAILIVLSILGNSLVCTAFVIQPRLRRVLYYPVLNLAVADILCGLVAMTSYLAKKHVFGGKKQRIVCDISRFSYFVTEYASVLSLTVISVERAHSVLRPLTHVMTVTSRRMMIVLCLIWCDAILVAGLPFFWQKPNASQNCSFLPTKAWSMMVISTNVLLPFLIILVSQASIYAIAIKHSILIKYQKRVVWRGEHVQARRKNSVRTDAWEMERKATISLSIVVGIFIICWGPSSVYYLVQTVCSQSFHGAFGKNQGLFNAVVKLLTFSNSCFNPILYAGLNKDFRNSILRVVGQRLVERQVRSETNESMTRSTQKRCGEGNGEDNRMNSKIDHEVTV